MLCNNVQANPFYILFYICILLTKYLKMDWQSLIISRKKITFGIFYYFYCDYWWLFIKLNIWSDLYGQKIETIRDRIINYRFVMNSNCFFNDTYISIYLVSYFEFFINLNIFTHYFHIEINNIYWIIIQS